MVCKPHIAGRISAGAIDYRQRFRVILPCRFAYNRLAMTRRAFNFHYSSHTPHFILCLYMFTFYTKLNFNNCDIIKQK